MKFCLIGILVFFFACSRKPSNEILPFVRFLIKSTEVVNLQGKVSGPGVVKNATVSLVSIPSNGDCVTKDGKPNGTILASTKTNEKGEYTLSYTRTRGIPCLVVTGTDQTTMEVSYGNKRSIPWNSGNNLFSIFQEPKSFQRNSRGQLNSSKTVNANPFTRIASARFLASRRGSNFTRNNNFFSKLKSLTTKAQTEEDLLAQAYKETIQTFFKGSNPNNFKLEEANPETKVFKARLGAIGTYAEKVGLPKGSPKSAYTGEIKPENLAKVLDFMERDFSDGSFDGKEVSNTGESSQISLEELEALGLDLNSADSFLKDEFLESLKYYADFDEEISENFWKGISFCDSDDESCEFTLNSGFPFSTYPYDGQTSVPSYFFVNLDFFEEVNPNSLSFQTQDGPCSGSIQISSNDFQTCLGATLEADSFYAFIYSETNSFQENTTYKIKLTSSIRKQDGTALLSSSYVMQTGFTISSSLYAISNQLVFDDTNFAVWTRCVLGSTFSGSSCSGTASTYSFCIVNDNSCNGMIENGILISGALYTACNDLNTNAYGGVTGWRVPTREELQILTAQSNFSSVFSDYTTSVWSASSYDTGNAYYYYYSGGISTQTKTTTTTAVRCISNSIPSF